MQRDEEGQVSVLNPDNPITIKSDRLHIREGGAGPAWDISEAPEFTDLKIPKKEKSEEDSVMTEDKSEKAEGETTDKAETPTADDVEAKSETDGNEKPRESETGKQESVTRGKAAMDVVVPCPQDILDLGVTEEQWQKLIIVEERMVRQDRRDLTKVHLSQSFA